MRYLRMLTNAVAGGVLMATYVAVVILQLNPAVPIVSTTALRWLGAVLSFYSPYLVVALYFLILGRDLFGSRPIRPAWLSVRLLAWLGTITTLGAAWLMWVNLHAFDVVMSERAVDHMRRGAWALSAAAVTLAAIAFWRYSFKRRGSRRVGVSLAVVVVASVVVPLALRGPAEVTPPVVHRWLPPARIVAAPRVHVIALDGASLGFIRERVAVGQLPNFGRVLDRGAVADLATIRPTQPESVWAAAATGKVPQKNGVRSSGLYQVSPRDVVPVDVLPDYCFSHALVDQGFIRAADRTAASLAARPLWSVLTDYGVTSGISGWPLTYPAHASLGYVLSDRFDEAASSPLRLADARAGDPTTASAVGREVFDAWQARPWRDILPASSPREAEPVGLDHARWDRAYSDAASELALEFAPRLLAVRYEALDTFGHTDLGAAEPDLFGEPRRALPDRSVLDRDYAYIDDEVGRATAALGPGDLLLVVSGFGMEPTPLLRRALARLQGDPNLTGTHESAPDGFLLAYGSNVEQNALPRGAIVDLTPTILYYMGVPIGRDMDGVARTDIFQPAFRAEHPVKYVASHER